MTVVHILQINIDPTAGQSLGWIADGKTINHSFWKTELIITGIHVTLYGNHVLELMFIGVPEPGIPAILSLAGLFLGGFF